MFLRQYNAVYTEGTNKTESALCINKPSLAVGGCDGRETINDPVLQAKFRSAVHHSQMMM